MAGDVVQQIKDRVSIIDVVSQYVELHQAGKNLKGKSPFTNEKTPSFYVSPDRGMYYCFSTSQGGDIFTFVQKMEGVDFKGALKLLAERAGVELVPEDPKKKTERDRLYDVLEAATAFYQEQFSATPAAEEYVKQRTVSQQTIAAWRIGYAPGPPARGWRETRAVLDSKQFTDDEMKRAGLIKGGEAGKEPFDVFRDRVMFPIFDPSGRVVGFSGRILTKDTDAPKYVNSPETVLFNKSEILYGYHRAKQGIRQYDFSLLVEGQFDVVMAHQAGYTNAVAVSGTALTEYQVGLLQRLSNRAVLALDADRAGIAAAKRAAELMLTRGMDVKVATLPEGSDPADLVAAGSDALKKCIKGATHIIEFLLGIIETASPDTRSFKLKVSAEVLPFVLMIPNRIDQEHFESVVATRLGTTKDAVHTEVERLRAKRASTQVSTSTTDNTSIPPRTTISTTTDRVNELRYHVLVLSELVPEEFRGPIESILTEINSAPLESLKATIPPEVKSELLFTLEERYQSLPRAQLKDELAHVLTQYRTSHFKHMLHEAHQALKTAEADKGDVTSALSAVSRAQKALGQALVKVEAFPE